MTIERRLLSVDDQGGVAYGNDADWETVFDGVWCRDEPRALSLVLAGGGFVSAAQHRVTCRYRAGVTPGMRLNLHDGSFWYIVTVIDEGGEHRWLTLTCSEQSTTGA